MCSLPLSLSEWLECIFLVFRLLIFACGVGKQNQSLARGRQVGPVYENKQVFFTELLV